MKFVETNQSRFDSCSIMWSGKYVFPPMSYIEFLKKFKEWPPKKKQLAVIHLNLYTRNIIDNVHTTVNEGIQYKTEDIDKWVIRNIDNKNISVGDCDDYAVTYQNLLVDKYHFLPSTVRLVLCRKMNGEYHLVTAVDTDNGTYIMDNTTKVVGPWTWYQYQWISREKPGSFWWESIKSRDRCKELTDMQMRPRKAIVQHLTKETE